MKTSIVRKAAEAYSNGQYDFALTLYEELSKTIGNAFFSANIEIIKGKLRNKNAFENEITTNHGVLTDRTLQIEPVCEKTTDFSMVTLAQPTLPVLPFEMTSGLPKSRLVIAAILDDFSHACFEPECELISIFPWKWREQLNDREIDFLFVESAWHGNGNAWQYRVAKYAAPPGNELSEVVAWARSKGIPTVFWNKEDPPNFDRFIDRATEFDYIFTTDENCISRYRDRVPVNTYVGVLPFAAQPRIHNSRIDKPRISSTSFAGTYYADDFVERRAAMDMLLRTSSRYGLSIFDRMFNVSGNEKERFLFPQDLQKFIHGALAYNDLLKAYRQYRVGLNVNSVSDSPTMFSRRVFELLACGTPVVSTESLGIDQTFGGIVSTVESDDMALQALDCLMRDPLNWLKTSVLGLRAVFEKHTYAHRIQKIAKTIGIESVIDPLPAPVVVVFPHGNAIRFASSMSLQRLGPAEVIVAGCGYSDSLAELHVNEIRAKGIQTIAIPVSNILTYLRHRRSEAAVSVCDSRHYYGPAYLLDAVIAIHGGSKEFASTILPETDPVSISERSHFETVANIGMITNLVQSGTLIAYSNHPHLTGAFETDNSEETSIINMPGLRTRAGFDFISNKNLLAGRAATINDLAQYV